MVGRFLCWLGFHSYGYVQVRHGVTVYKCLRCHYSPGAYFCVICAGKHLTGAHPGGPVNR